MLQINRPLYVSVYICQALHLGGKTPSLELLSTAAGTVDNSDVSTLKRDSFCIVAALSVHLKNKGCFSDNSKITEKCLFQLSFSVSLQKFDRNVFRPIHMDPKQVLGAIM